MNVLPAHAYTDCMAFTVEDYRDLVQLLREHPEWRSELRRELLGDELLRLPELVAENTAAITRLEAAIESLRVGLERTDARIEALITAQEETSRTLTEFMRVAQVRADGHDAEIGNLKGISLANYFFDRPHLLGQRLRRPRSVVMTDLIDLDELLETGQITPDEDVALRNLDLLVRGRAGSGEAAADIYLAVEVSGVIHLNDVERARDRARLLKRLGLDARPVVAGSAIGGQAGETAVQDGVAIVLREPN